METEPSLVFVGLDTDTVDEICADSFVIDIEAAVLSDQDRDVLDVADQLGVLGDDATAIIRRVGVPVAELWAAYKREQQPTAIKPNEITGTRCGQYSDGTWDYSVTFVFDYATITVAVEYGGEIDDDDDETVPDDVAESAARILADHYGIIVAVES